MIHFSNTELLQFMVFEELERDVEVRLTWQKGLDRSKRDKSVTLDDHQPCPTLVLGHPLSFM